MIKLIFEKLQMYGFYFESVEDIKLYLESGERDIFSYLSPYECALIKYVSIANNYYNNNEDFTLEKWKELALGAKYDIPERVSSKNTKEEVLIRRELRLYLKHGLDKYYSLPYTTDNNVCWRTLESLRLFYLKGGKYDFENIELYSPTSINRAAQLIGKVKYPLTVIGRYDYFCNAVFEVIQEAYVRGVDISHWFLIDNNKGVFQNSNISMVKSLKDLIVQFGVDDLDDIHKVLLQMSSLYDWSKGDFIKNCVFIKSPSFVIDLFNKGYPLFDYASKLNDYAISPSVAEKDLEVAKDVIRKIDSKSFSQWFYFDESLSIDDYLLAVTKEKKAFDFLNKNIANFKDLNQMMKLVSKGITVDQIKSMPIEIIENMTYLKGDLKKALDSSEFKNILPYLERYPGDLFVDQALNFIGNKRMLKSLHEFSSYSSFLDNDEKVKQYILDKLEEGFSTKVVMEIYNYRDEEFFKKLLKCIPKDQGILSLGIIIENNVKKFEKTHKVKDLPF